MAKQEYEKYLDGDDYVYVSFTTERARVIRFVVKLRCRVGKEWFEVVRYDGGHSVPHKDILLPDGNVERKVWYKYMNNNQALDFALDEVEEQYDFFRWRFERWLKTRDQQ